MKNLESKNRLRFWLLLGVTVLLFGFATFVLMPPRHTYTVSLETTVALGPLDADGYVDYVAALNERLKGDITPERNANVLIWQAIGPRTSPQEYFEWLGRPAPPEEGEYLVEWSDFNGRQMFEPPSRREQLDRAGKWPWKADDDPELAAWLESNATPLDKFTKASKFTDYYNPLVPARASKDEPGLLIGCLLSNAQGCRNAATQFACRAMLRLGSGRIDDAWADLITCHRLGRMLQKGGTLAELFVGIGIERVALRGEAIFLSHAKLTRPQIDACLADLGGIPAPAKAADKVDLTGRFMMLDIAQNLARTGTDALKPLGLRIKEIGDEALVKVLLSRSTDWNVGMKTTNAIHDRAIAILRIEDLPTRMEKMAIFEAEMRLMNADIKKQAWAASMQGAAKRGELFGNFVSSQFLPAVGMVMIAEEQVAQENEHLILALALKSLHLETGAYPARLDDLTPKYLPKIPIDRFSGGPLKYERRDNGYRIYSVGPNRVDDTGNEKEASPPGNGLSITMPAIEPPPPRILKDPFDP